MLYSESGTSAIRWRLISMGLKTHPTPWRKAGYVDDRRSDNSKENISQSPSQSLNSNTIVHAPEPQVPMRS